MRLPLKYFFPEKKQWQDFETWEGSNYGDWVDLRAAETIEIKQFEYKLISLGFSMELPEGYEANIVPRSSTFKYFGIIQANHFGVIDNTYSGDNDVWKFPAIALRDTVIEEGDRICQFRLNKVQPTIEIEFVTELTGKNRGGFGQSGKK